MANEIKALFGTPTALTITLASLATSTAGVGRQSTMVNNATTRFQRLHILGKITTGTNPTVNKTIGIYFLRSDGTRRTDAAGTSDAGHTVVTADLVYACAVSATSDVAYSFGFYVDNPGPEWGITVVHDTAVNLNSTGGNHAIYYTTDNPEVQ